MVSVSAECRPLYRPRYLPIVGRYVDHHSADISVDTSVDTSTDTSQSTYRPTLDRYVDRHIGRHSAAMTTDTSVECRSICRLRCRPIYRSRGVQNTHAPNKQIYWKKIFQNQWEINLFKSEGEQKIPLRKLPLPNVPTSIKKNFFFPINLIESISSHSKWLDLSSSDADECSLGTHTCDTTSSRCVDTEGDFYCRCKDGFTQGVNNKICDGAYYLLMKEMNKVKPINLRENLRISKMCRPCVTNLVFVFLQRLITSKKRV